MAGASVSLLCAVKSFQDHFKGVVDSCRKCHFTTCTVELLHFWKMKLLLMHKIDSLPVSHPVWCWHLELSLVRRLSTQNRTPGVLEIGVVIDSGEAVWRLEIDSGEPWHEHTSTPAVAHRWGWKQHPPLVLSVLRLLPTWVLVQIYHWEVRLVLVVSWKCL